MVSLLHEFSNEKAKKNHLIAAIKNRCSTSINNNLNDGLILEPPEMNSCLPRHKKRLFLHFLQSHFPWAFSFSRRKSQRSILEPAFDDKNSTHFLKKFALPIFRHWYTLLYHDK